MVLVDGIGFGFFIFRGFVFFILLSRFFGCSLLKMDLFCRCIGVYLLREIEVSVGLRWFRNFEIVGVVKGCGNVWVFRVD